jgi:hypothetical protein
MAERLTACPRPYLYVEELAELTPWTIEAIHTKVRRGELQRGLHYFQDERGERLIFKWDAVVEFIERGSANGTSEGASRPPHPAPTRKVLDVEKAKAGLQRMLD